MTHNKNVLVDNYQYNEIIYPILMESGLDVRKGKRIWKFLRTQWKNIDDIEHATEVYCYVKSYEKGYFMELLIQQRVRMMEEHT